MPINNITVYLWDQYPGHPTYNLAEVGQSILDRYYQSFVGHLQNNQYRFLPGAKYEKNFRGEIPLSFVISDLSGGTFDAGKAFQWLVFLLKEEGALAFVT
jgi:hypothetical protein